MSNYRNVLSGTRRAHRERSQPLARAKFGLLEKHSDYVERAKNYHTKEKTLKQLALKASLRNPDEFYFGMLKESTKDGIHIKQRENPLQNKKCKELIGMKKQDINYLSMKEQQQKSKIEKDMEQLQGLSVPASERHHIIFCEENQQVNQFSPASYFSTAPEYLDRSFNRPTESMLSSSSFLVNPPKDTNIVSRVMKDQEKNYKELVKKMNKKRKVEQEKMNVQTQLMGMEKGKKQKIIVENTETGKKMTMYKFRQERKK
jgi:U3 small nucleolar RNA-associated protein 11